MTRAFLICLMTLTGSTALAGGLLPSDKVIEISDWRAQVLGNTVYYWLDGQYYGREYYWANGKNVTFQHVSGACLKGEWIHDVDTGAFCFDFPDAGADLQCFYHATRGDQTLIINLIPEDEGDQSVEAIVEGGFQCEMGMQG